MSRHRTFLFLITCLVVGVALLSNQQVREVVRSSIAWQMPVLRKFLFPREEKPIAKRLAEAGFRLGQPALIRVYKNESTLEVWLKKGDRFELFRDYKICKFSGGLGPKLKEGDRQAPEGYYFATERQLLPSSRHHRAINTGFPNSFDQELGRTGTVLMIHGDCSSIGCYAMTDPAIDDIYTIVEEALRDGHEAVPMHLYPFRMTEKNLKKYAKNQWINYWKNLAEGDAIFHETGLPPKVWSCGGKYQFKVGDQACRQVAGW